jgi:hypothetical protein
VALEWLFSRTNDGGLEQRIAELGEPIRARALVQLLRERQRQPLWYLLLLTDEALHFLGGTESDLLHRILARPSPRPDELRIPFSSIASISIPERHGWLARLMGNPTRIATLSLRDGSTPMRIEVDGVGVELLVSAAGRIDDASAAP